MRSPSDRRRDRPRPQPAPVRAAPALRRCRCPPASASARPRWSRPAPPGSRPPKLWISRGAEDCRLLVSTAGAAFAITLGFTICGVTVCADGAKLTLRRSASAFGAGAGAGLGAGVGRGAGAALGTGGGSTSATFGGGGGGGRSVDQLDRDRLVLFGRGREPGEREERSNHGDMRGDRESAREGAAPAVRGLRKGDAGEGQARRAARARGVSDAQVAERRGAADAPPDRRVSSNSSFHPSRPCNDRFRHHAPSSTPRAAPGCSNRATCSLLAAACAAHARVRPPSGVSRLSIRPAPKLPLRCLNRVGAAARRIGGRSRHHFTILHSKTS